MRKYNFLEPEVADSLMQLPLVLNYNLMSHLHGPAPYFRDMLRVHLVRWLREYNAGNNTSYNLYTDGLKIHTTLDFHLQLMAEQALREQMARLQLIVDHHYRNVRPQDVQHLINRQMSRSGRYQSLKSSGKSEADIKKAFQTPTSMSSFSWSTPEEELITPLDSILRAFTILHAGIVSLEPSTGHIKAWVGGNNFRFFQFDNVMSQRQAGSAFKPFVYAAAIEAGVDPCEFIMNESFELEEYENWSPGNHDGNYEGYYSMQGQWPIQLTLSAPVI
jgi:penicillin-binding protein 1A